MVRRFFSTLAAVNGSGGGVNSPTAALNGPDG